MNEKVKQIFDILGLEPEEIFSIAGAYENIYKIDTNLHVWYKNKLTDVAWFYVQSEKGLIVELLQGLRTIIKIPQKPKLTNKDKIAIKFLKNCGFHYLVKSDIKDLLNALENMPDKVTVDDERIVWVMNGDNYYFPTNAFDMPISHKEPLCLDDFTDENLKED